MCVCVCVDRRSTVGGRTFGALGLGERRTIENREFHSWDENVNLRDGYIPYSFIGTSNGRVLETKIARRPLRVLVESRANDYATFERRVVVVVVVHNHSFRVRLIIRTYTFYLLHAPKRVPAIIL